MKTASIMALILMAILLCSCAPGPNTGEDQPDHEGNVAGFWLGLWHGIIVLAMFFLSLFCDSVSVYEVHNSGGWYDFGFALGVGAFSSGASSTVRRSK